ncbi:oxygenase MpaB family protein [Allosphingosinicella deserti]|uniref:Histidine kinase n=1 Tax=Allosphingosinicella deserti TaxID=2116704 RepID=A0A2P7QEQ1_9SPHN|nr:oxygenase MpaB family protein [Sphingomonas deserti]PSJ36447.1 histidine kinase [Sphingomonas deserti]
MQTLQRAIQGQVQRLVGPTETQARPAPPPSGPSFLAPHAVSREVHGDFTTMLVGGISGLLLQMLHPGALAGVWDHSNFRADMSGRLRRTAQFISVTTYGMQSEAEQMIGRIRLIHDHVHGRLPDGRTYSANDPDLLTWVHVAGASSFLAAYLRYRNPGMSGAAQDLYYVESARTAERLGAGHIPQSRREVARYLEQVRPHLLFDHRTDDVARAILGQPAPSLALVPYRELVTRASIDLLPSWAARMHRLSVPEHQRPAVRAGLRSVAAITRWALDSGREPPRS